MSTLRQDPTTNEWVILAPRRAARPQLPERPARPQLPAHDPACPFCPGNESMTPPELARVSGPDGRWRVRVVPNRYEAVGANGHNHRNGRTMLREMGGRGAHEVVIESQRHDARFDEMAERDTVEVLLTWRDRYRDLRRRPWARAIVVFKNFGPMAGTSLTHAHSQIVAVPVYPPAWLRAFDTAVRYFDDQGRGLYDDLVRAERDAGERMIAERGRFTAFAPFAGGTPFETWIVPTFHQASFGQLPDEDAGDLAALLRDVLHALRIAVDDPDFNLVVHSGPAEDVNRRLFRWHVRLLPKLTTPAGFELGSGMMINTVAPEDAALALRGALALSSNGHGAAHPPAAGGRPDDVP